MQVLHDYIKQCYKIAKGVKILEFISVWAQGIIVSVIIATIIEMILPNSSNSKYIKVVIGVFILFTIISPIINKFSSNKISDKINFDSYIDTSTNNSAITTNVNLNNEDILNNDEYTLSKIDLKIVAKNESINQNNNTNVTTIVENIENIRVDIGGSSKNKEEEKSVISESEKRKLKEYLSSVYEVSENNIFVN